MVVYKKSGLMNRSTIYARKVAATKIASRLRASHGSTSSSSRRSRASARVVTRLQVATSSPKSSTATLTALRSRPSWLCASRLMRLRALPPWLAHSRSSRPRRARTTRRSRELFMSSLFSLVNPDSRIRLPARRRLIVLASSLGRFGSLQGLLIPRVLR